MIAVMRNRPALYAVLLAALLATSPAAAQSSGPEKERTPEEQIRDGVERILRGLESLIGKVPIYEMPELQENGDIIIRRKNPPKKKEQPADSDDTDST